MSDNEQRKKNRFSCSVCLAKPSSWIKTMLPKNESWVSSNRQTCSSTMHISSFVISLISTLKFHLWTKHMLCRTRSEQQRAYRQTLTALPIGLSSSVRVCTSIGAAVDFGWAVCVAVSVAICMSVGSSFLGQLAVNQKSDGPGEGWSDGLSCFFGSEIFDERDDCHSD